MLRDFSLRDFGASLNTVESYTNESSQGKIGLYETVSKQKCTHLGMFLASVVYSSTATNENPVSSLRVSNIGIKAADIEETAMGYSDKRCSDYANYLLKKKMRMAIAGTITCTPLPHLDCNRIVKVYQNEEDVNEIDFLIEEIQIPLSPEAYSLSVCNIQDLPLTCYTSTIPRSELSEWVAFRDTNSLGKYINKNNKTLAVVESFVNGKTITAIGGGRILEDGDTITYNNDPIRGMQGVEILYIENGITDIKSGAFNNRNYGNASKDYNDLERIYFPNSLKNIGQDSFAYCFLDKETIVIPDNTEISNGAFYKSYIKSLVVGKNCYISFRSFANCDNLEKLVINDNCYIGTNCFEGCSSLKSVIFNGSMDNTSELYSTFYDCINLIDVKLPNNLLKISNSAFYNCSNLLNIEIPNGVVSIGNNSFQFCYNLINISLPESLQVISYSAFWHCHSLKSITIPQNVTNVDRYAFYYCTNLESVVFAEDVKIAAINDSTFKNCINLKRINIPNSVTSICENAFFWCMSLENIIIPNNVTIIETKAFCGCSNLTNIKIPDNVIEIQGGVFSQTALLENQTGIKYADTWVINCDYYVTDVRIKDGTKGIADGALTNASNLQSVYIPNSMISIGKSVFQGLAKLTSIIIPNSVQRIGDSAFMNCSKLIKITIENPECEIYDSEYTISSTATIYGYANSTAQSYAEKYSRTFVEITE